MSAGGAPQEVPARLEAKYEIVAVNRAQTLGGQSSEALRDRRRIAGEAPGQRSNPRQRLRHHGAVLRRTQNPPAVTM